MGVSMTRKTLVSKKIIATVAATIVLLLLSFLAWRALYNPAVTDAEAREFIADFDSVGLSGSEGLCDYAIFDRSCERTIEDGPTASLVQPSTVICTWVLSGSEKDRVVEIENVNPDGNGYRTSVLVSRDGNKFKGWPLPYWEYPTREIPDEASDPAPIEDLPTSVEAEFPAGFDPCVTLPSE